MNFLPIMPLGRVYKLYDSGNPDQFYVGSTENSIEYRISGHKSQAYNDGRDTILHCYIRQTDPEDFYLVFVIELLEEVIFENRTELLVREQNYIDLLQPTLNEQRAIRHERADEIEYEQSKKWRSARVICENCGIEIARGSSYSHSKICSDENRLKKLEKRQQAIERREEWKKMMVNCTVCDNLYTQASMWAHMKLHEQRNDEAQFAYLW